MTRLTVTIPSKPYDVWIENGLLEQAGALVRDVLGHRQKLFVVTVAPVKRKWGKKLNASLTRAGYKPQFLEMPDGERHKALPTVEKLAEQLVKLGADRKAAILAFGGGVIGDVTGLLASLYMNILAPYQNVTVLYGHIHREHDHTEGNIRHLASRSLIFAFPDPEQAQDKKPIAFDKEHPFRNLGGRLIKEDNGRAAVTSIPMDEVQLSLREFHEINGVQQILKPLSY